MNLGSRWPSVTRTFLGLTCAGTMILMGCGGSTSSRIGEKQLALTYGFAQNCSEISREDIEVILDDMRKHS